MSNNESLYGREVPSAMQREQERERRRMRDRQRRESMTADEREKHLARRRRNYQLRRLRAGNPQSGSDGDQAVVAPGHESRGLVDALDFSAGGSSGCNKDYGLELKDLDVRGVGHGGEKLSIFQGELRLSQVRYLARSLDGFQRKLISAYLFSNSNPASNYIGASGRKLRLTQVKCLARELNSEMKHVTSHLRQLPPRSMSNGEETSLSQEVSHDFSEQANTTELDSIINYGEPLTLMCVDTEVDHT